MIIEIPETINEHSEFPATDSLTPEVTLNFENHVSLNSAGIAKWIKWIELCSDRHFILKSVSVSFMSQAASITSLLPKDYSIESFKIPLYSEELKTEKESLVEMNNVELDLDGNLKINLENVIDSEGDWEVDVFSDSFFEPIIHQLQQNNL